MGAKKADQFLKEAYMAHYTTESYEKTPFYATHHEFLTKALRAYAESIREECARVGEREAVEFRITAAQVPDRFVCSEYLRAAMALDHNARAIRSLEIK